MDVNPSVLETRSSDQLPGSISWAPLGVLAPAAPSAWNTVPKLQGSA